MLALSPPWFPNLGWSLEEEMIAPDRRSWACIDDDPLMSYNNSRETASSESLPRFSSSPREVCFEGTKKTLLNESSSTVKKLSHNANERDRRKKLNGLYASLRDLLPDSDHSKKLSIPGTVSRVLKYIPQLQIQVEKLTQRKEDVLSKLSARQGEQLDCRKGRKEPKMVLSSPSIVASQVDEREVVFQICASDVGNNPLSQVLQTLEEEGLNVINASTFATPGDRVFYTLHLQVNDASKMECGMLNEKLLCFYGS